VNESVAFSSEGSPALVFVRAVRGLVGLGLEADDTDLEAELPVEAARRLLRLLQRAVDAASGAADPV
jgi:hypothetical protein